MNEEDEKKTYKYGCINCGNVWKSLRRRRTCTCGYDGIHDYDDEEYLEEMQQRKKLIDKEPV